MKRVLLLSSIILILTSELVFCQKSTIEFLHLKKGLSHTHANAVLQDYQGYIWIATESGLNRYDGVQFKIYEANENDSATLPSNRVLDIFEDSKHQLWFACNLGGLLLFDRKKENFKRYQTSKDTTSISNDRVSVIFEDKDHFLWVGTEDGLNKFDPKTGKSKRFMHINKHKDKSLPENITDIIQDKLGRIWVTTRNGLNVLYPGKSEFQNILPRLKKIGTNPNLELSKIIIDKNGDYWVGTLEYGIVKIHESSENTFEFTSLQHNSNDPNSLSNNRVLSMLEDKDGIIWIGSENGGLNQFNPETGLFERFQNDNSNSSSLADNSIWDIFQDNNGRIWLSTYSQGIELIDPYARKFSQVSIKQDGTGLNYKNVTTFLEVNDELWIGTDGGGINIWNRKTNEFSYLMHDEKNPKSIGSNAVLKLFKDRDGEIWATTWAGGINRFDAKLKTFKHYMPDASNPKAILAPHAFEMVEDSKGNLWFATFQAGLALFDKRTESFQHFTYDKNDSTTISFNNLLTLCIGEGDTIWAGTTQGISQVWLDKQGVGHTKRFSNYEYLPRNVRNDAARSLVRDSKNRIWMCFTNELILYDHGKYISISTKNEFPGSFTNGVIEDEKGDFWIASSKGLVKLHFTDQDYNFTIEIYDDSDGLSNTTYSRHSFYRTTKNEYFVGGDNGFNYFTLQNILGNPHKPQVLFSELKLFNKPIKIGGSDSLLKSHVSLSNHITFNHKQNVFSLDFIALNYTHPEKNQYAFKLEGFDQDWNYTGTNHVATYTNLSAGDYEFHVKAANSDGVWSDKDATMSITILPPFWETLWFRILAIFIAVASILSFYFSRINRIKAQKKELEIQVKERTKELRKSRTEILQQNEEIRTINDQLENKNVVLEERKQDLERKNEIITSSIQYARTIQGAILPLKQTIQQAFDHFAYLKPRDIVSGDFYWFAHENKGTASEVIIIAAVDCTGHGVPGAFMSMIGSTILNDIVRIGKEYDPANILTNMNLRIQSALKQEQTQNTDGMDVCLCAIRMGSSELERSVHFAGAKRPLFYTQNQGDVERINGNKVSLGGKHRHEVVFTTHELTLYKGDLLYLTSDGYIDQNNIERKRFGTLEFMAVLNQIKPLHLEQQEKQLDDIITNYRQSAEQRDDMVVVGVKL